MSDAPANVRPTPAPTAGGCGRLVFRLVLFGSIALNVLLLLALTNTAVSTDEVARLEEKYLFGAASGDRGGADKVAVVRVEGVLVEGMTKFAQRQIEKAARDPAVKAVVVRIDSPGGTISASEDLHRRLVDLRDGSHTRFSAGKKPIVASMGSIAASGGYYIAAPAPKIVAETTTITGSIGVYASFPNLKGFGEKNGISWPLVKAGAIKGSGGLFAEITPQERQPWQDMVDNAYGRFKTVVEDGRPALKGKLEDTLFERDIPIYNDKGEVEQGKPPVKYRRYRADGGIFTSQDAEKYGLIDEIGTIDRAVDLAKAAAGLKEARVIRYEPPSKSVFDLLNGDIGLRERSAVDLRRLASAGVPRVWYLEPGSELAGLLAVGEE